MSFLSLPDQTIPEKQKDKAWHMLHAEGVALHFGSKGYLDSRSQMRDLYRTYFAELSPEKIKQVKSITCPDGFDLGVDYIVYPLAQSKVEQIVGEFMLRPSRRKAYAVDKRSKNKKHQKMLQMLSEEIMREHTKGMKPDLGFQPQTENPDMQLPENIEEFFEKDYKMLAEEVADKLITYFLDVRKEKQKFRELFIDYCIVDRAHAILDKDKGHTTIRKVHPLDADYDISPYKIIQDDHEYFTEGYWLTENEVYNTWKLDHETKAEVKKMFESLQAVADGHADSNSLTSTLKHNGWYDTTNKIGRIRLVHVMWKSTKTVTYKESTNKATGENLYKKVSKPRKNDETKTISGEMPRHVVMLGPDICLSYGVMDQRFSTVSDPWNCTLPVLSIIRDNTTGSSVIKSVVSKVEQLQDMASEILFEIRLAIKHAGDSRVLVYDTAQTPKAFSNLGYQAGLNKVMHHVKKDKMMFINSKERGAKGFNQFSSLDLSQKNGIQDLFNGLAIIEDLASKFVGISPEREGNVGQYQTKGGTDAAIRGSAARTEVIYTPFDDFIQALLEKALMKMRKDYEENEVITYVIGEMKTKFIKLYKEFFEADLGIYLSDGRKDKQNADRVDAAIEAALANAGNPPELIMGMIDAFEGESANEKKAVFQRMLNTMEKMRAENQKAMQAQAEQEAEDKKAAREDAMKIAKERNENNLEVAYVYNNGKTVDTNNKLTSQEAIEGAKLSLEAQKEVVKEQ